MFLRTARHLPIGLDLGHDSVKLVQLVHTADGPKVLAAAKEVIGEEIKGVADRRQASLTAASRLLATRGFKGRKVVACLPREIIHLKNIRLPVMPVSEVGAAVAFEAANAFNFDLSNATLKHIVAGEIRHGSESRLEVMCLAIQKAEIDEFVEQAHFAGLELAGLEFEPASLFAGTNRLLPGAATGATTLVLDIGYRRSQVIIGRAGEVQLFKPIDVGSRRLVASVARKLSITEKEAAALRLQLDDKDGHAAIDESVRNAVEDATRQTMTELAKEVALCLRYFSVTFRGVRIKDMRITGGEANCTLLRRLLKTELTTAVQDWPSLEYANAVTGSLRLAPWALSIALAARNLPVDRLVDDGPPAQAWEPASNELEVVRG